MYKVLISNENETCVRSSNSMLGPIFLKSEFITCGKIVTCDYRNSNISVLEWIIKHFGVLYFQWLLYLKYGVLLKQDM